MCAEADYVVVTTTVESDEDAGKLAQGVVKERLAACVQKTPIQSTYWWKGSVESSSEQLLLMKTRASLSGKLTEFIKQNHSYEVPEIVVLPLMGGHPDYLHWIEAETTET
jgi:periplasmic divalent cation tolerance protein